MNQPRFKIPSVAKIHRFQFFAALVESEELKIGSRVIEPCHSFRCRAPCACRHNHFESAEVPPRIGALPAVVEPQNSQRQNPIHNGSGLGFAYADDRVGGCAAQQPPAHIGRPKAVLKIHRRAESIHLCVEESPCKYTLQQPLVVAAAGIACCRCPPVAGGNKLQRLRLGCAHAPRHQAQALRTLLHVNDGAHQVPLFTPKLQQAAPVRLAHRVVSDAHIEEDTPIFKQSCRGMIGEITFDGFGEPASRGRGAF